MTYRLSSRGLVAMMLAATVVLPMHAGVTPVASSTALGPDIVDPGTADASFVLVYAAGGQNFAVDTTVVRAGELRAWWIDPAVGTVVDAGSVPRDPSVDFFPPTTSAADAGRPWVLVVGDATQPIGGPAALLGAVFVPLVAPAVGAASGLDAAPVLDAVPALDATPAPAGTSTRDTVPRVGAGNAP